jgi:membrane protein DedA with SNARE-associated domain
MSLEYLITTYGYWALLVGTFLEGETVLILAGFAARTGYLHLPWVMAVAFAGSLLGDQTFFLLGRWQGKRLLDRWASWQPRIEKANRLVDRYHTWILLGFRFLYGLRTVIPFALGTTSIGLGRFLVLNALGAAVWSVAVALVGYLFGAAAEALLADVKRYELWVILVIAGVGASVWVWHQWRRRRSHGPVPPGSVS